EHRIGFKGGCDVGRSHLPLVRYLGAQPRPGREDVGAVATPHIESEDLDVTRRTKRRSAVEPEPRELSLGDTIGALAQPLTRDRAQESPKDWIRHELIAPVVDAMC